MTERGKRERRSPHLSRHLSELEDLRIIEVEWQGTRKHHSLNSAPLARLLDGRQSRFIQPCPDRVLCHEHRQSKRLCATVREMEELLRDAVSGLSKVAVFWLRASGPRQLEAVRSAAAALELTVEVFEVGRPSEFEAAFQAAAKSKASGVLMLSSPLFSAYPQALADLALINRLPAISIFPDFAQKGGLIAYGPDLLTLYPQASVMTRKLLQGASAADLPIERPTRFKLIANLKTASALGLTLPTSILLSADEVIE